MSNTPCASVKIRRKHVETWVNSQWKNPTHPGQISAGINSQDLIANFQAFTTSLGNLVRAFGTPAVPMVTHALHALTVGIDDLTIMVSRHPGAAKAIGIIGVAVGGFLAVFGAAALITAMIGAVGFLAGPLGLLALAGGIVALGAAFDKIPKWLIAMAAGAAVGGSIGSVVPIVGTTVGALTGAASGVVLYEVMKDHAAVDATTLNPSAPGYQTPMQRLQAAQDAAAAHLRAHDLTAVHGALGTSQQVHVIVDNTHDIAKHGAVATTASLARHAQKPPRAPNFGTPSMTPYYPSQMGGLY